MSVNKARLHNMERCKNWGGYDQNTKMVVCGLYPNKQCAGFDRGCSGYRATRYLRPEEIVHD